MYTTQHEEDLLRERIRSLIHMEKLTENSFAKQINRQPTNVYQVLTGERRFPRGFVGELDGVNIVVVPQSYFPTNVKCVIWHKDALLGAKQIMKTRIITDSELVDGSVLTGRFIFGSFALDAKKKAIASITSSTISG